MSDVPIFICVCPHCEKRNQYNIRLLAQRTRCAHCCGTLTAQDSNALSAATHDPIYYWIQFTENAFTLGEPDQPAIQSTSDPLLQPKAGQLKPR